MSKSHFYRICHSTQTRDNSDPTNSKNSQILYIGSKSPNCTPYKN